MFKLISMFTKYTKIPKDWIRLKMNLVREDEGQ